MLQPMQNSRKEVCITIMRNNKVIKFTSMVANKKELLVCWNFINSSILHPYVCVICDKSHTGHEPESRPFANVVIWFLLINK